MRTSSWSHPARSPSSMPSSTSRKTSSSRSRRKPSASASGSCRRMIARRPPGPPGWRTRRRAYRDAPLHGLKFLMAEDIMSAWETSKEPPELRRKFDDDEDEFEDDGFTFDDDDEEDEDLDDEDD